MILRLPEPPQQSVDALGKTLSSLASRGQFGVRTLRHARPEQLSVTAPHQVYTLDLVQLRDGAPLDSARQTAWRYLLEKDEQVVASAETVTTERGKHAFSHVTSGPFVTGTLQALSVAEDLAGDRDAEMRLLHAPALYFMGVWLRPVESSGDEDQIIVVAPAPPGFDANRPYPAAEILEQLRERAQTIPDMKEGDTRGG